MYKNALFLIMASALLSCVSASKKTIKSYTMEEVKQHTSEPAPTDDTPKVLGIGGFSFFQIIQKK